MRIPSSLSWICPCSLLVLLLCCTSCKKEEQQDSGGFPDDSDTSMIVSEQEEAIASDMTSDMGTDIMDAGDFPPDSGFGQ